MTEILLIRRACPKSDKQVPPVMCEVMDSFECFEMSSYFFNVFIYVKNYKILRAGVILIFMQNFVCHWVFSRFCAKHLFMHMGIFLPSLYLCIGVFISQEQMISDET